MKELADKPDSIFIETGVTEISEEEWRIIRAALKLILRRSKSVRKSSEVKRAVNCITRSEDREVFIAYYLKDCSVTNIHLNHYFSERTVIKYLNRAVKEFVIAYHKGILMDIFKAN